MDEQEYKCVGITSLESRLPLSFDIYLKQKESYIKYAKAGMKMTKDSVNGLLRSGVLQVFVKAQDFISYNEYMRKTLSQVLDDASAPIEQKSKVVYDAATDIMNELFSNPISKPILESAKEISGTFINKILNDKKAFFSLLRVCSFDYYTYTHCINVAIYAIEIGKKAGLEGEAIKELGESAILHDLGKSKIESGILNKEGALNEAEFEEMKKHALYGFDILSGLGEKNKNILDGIKCHHEKIDGTGYPFGLKNGDIPLIAQIIAVADVFDALTTRRSYKPAMSSFQAFKILKNQMKNALNQSMVDTFIICMKA